jgi:hypothetical protein
LVERKSPNPRARTSSQPKTGKKISSTDRRSSGSTDRRSEYKPRTSSGSTDRRSSGSTDRRSENKPRTSSGSTDRRSSGSAKPYGRPGADRDKPRTSSGSTDRRSSGSAKPYGRPGADRDKPRTSSSSTDRRSEYKPRTSSSSTDRRSSGSAKPYGRPGADSDNRRGGRGERQERPDKFDTPRRFRGDMPRRERDQRARGSAPVIDQDVTGDELGTEMLEELKTLPTGLTITVAQHLVMAERYLEIDAPLALVHAQHAKELAGRFPIVREIAGVAHYINENWQEALNDFRAVKRMGQSEHLVAMMADCERGLNRPERALEILATNKELSGTAKIEAVIVEAGARSDLLQHEAALVALKIPALTGYPADQTAYARLCFAYATTLLHLNRPDEAQIWFGKADSADPAATDASNHLNETDQTIFLDDLDVDE